MNREVQKVDLPSRFGVAFVRALNPIEDIGRIEALGAAGDDKSKLIAVQLSAYACNEEGEPLYATPDAALEYMKLSSTRSGVVTKIVTAGARFNDLDEEAVGEAEKN